MAEEFYTHEFDNGLMLVAQRMEVVSSAAMGIALPMGSSRDPGDEAGSASVAANWLLRGAGDRDTRQLNDALDALGCQHHEGARSERLVLSACQLGRNLPDILAIYSDVIRRPRLAEEAFDSCRDLVSQALDALEDEPLRMCNVLIREKFYPAPLGRNPLGTKESLSALGPQAVRRSARQCMTPGGTIVAVAGKFDWQQLLEAVGQHFSDWRGEMPPEVSVSPPGRGLTHLTKPTAQVQITLAYPAATINEEQYYAGRVAEMVLSGGMGARLFTEVREKRALAYAVIARYHCLKGHAGMFVYAGTTPERAQETLDVTVGELRRLRDGIEEDELARARTQLKSALILQGESTPARAEALAMDFYHLGRLRSLAEISAAIDAIRVGDVLEYLQAYPAQGLTLLTIGPEELDTSGLP